MYDAHVFDSIFFTIFDYRGVWNVPFITNCYLVKISVFRTPAAKSVTYSREDVDPDMALCASLRESVSIIVTEW